MNNCLPSGLSVDPLTIPLDPTTVLMQDSASGCKARPLPPLLFRPLPTLSSLSLSLPLCVCVCVCVSFADNPSRSISSSFFVEFKIDDALVLELANRRHSLARIENLIKQTPSQHVEPPDLKAAGILSHRRRMRTSYRKSSPTRIISCRILATWGSFLPANSKTERKIYNRDIITSMKFQ